ncbi:hypothetical protein EsH8_VIII_000132 [Colletotrichum jinshuiense]
MKFFNVGLVALSSLLATSSAAPAIQGLPSGVDIPKIPSVPVQDLPSDVEIPKVPSVNTPVNVDADVLSSRAEQVVFTKVQTTVVEVKKHCSTINSTVEGVSGGQVSEKKADIIKLVKSEVTVIVTLIQTLVGDIIELVSETTEIVGEEKEKIVGLVLELVFEILFTLKNVLKVLGISKSRMNHSFFSSAKIDSGIFELLGPLVLVLLTTVAQLLTVLNTVVEGLLQLVSGVLGGVVGLLLEVLKGLLPVVVGLIGGVLNKLDLGGLLCSLL